MTEVIIFTQETCGACTTQRQENEGIESDFPDIEFREVDIQENLDTAEEYGVRKTPTTLIHADDERTAEFVGVVEHDELEDAIRDAETATDSLREQLSRIFRG